MFDLVQLLLAIKCWPSLEYASLGHNILFIGLRTRRRQISRFWKIKIIEIIDKFFFKFFFFFSVIRAFCC
jgi:hypothetical protein